MATPTIDIRSHSKERNNTEIVQEIVKDLLKSETFIALVKDSVEKKIKEMQETLDQQQADILELQVKNDKKTKKNKSSTRQSRSTPTDWTTLNSSWMPKNNTRGEIAYGFSVIQRNAVKIQITFFLCVTTSES